MIEFSKYSTSIEPTSRENVYAQITV